MTIKIEIERFSVTSSKPFDQVVAVLEAAIGHPEMAEFARSTHEARSFAELKCAVEVETGEMRQMVNHLGLSSGVALDDLNGVR